MNSRPNLPKMPVTTSFPPPPTVPYPKPKFPLRTASKERPSLELYIGPEKVEPVKVRFQNRLGVFGVAFMVLRVCLFAFLIAAIAMFVSGMNKVTSAGVKAPAEFVGGVTVSGLACVYVLITFILYYVNLMPVLFTGIVDALLFIASVVVASLVGKGLPKLDCAAINNNHKLAGHFKLNGDKYSSYTSFDKDSCKDSKAVWGIYVVICLLFVFSALDCVALWNRVRRDSKGQLDLEV